MDQNKQCIQCQQATLTPHDRALLASPAFTHTEHVSLMPLLSEQPVCMAGRHYIDAKLSHLITLKQNQGANIHNRLARCGAGQRASAAQ
eukprot:149430-Ditylum_brightwellii.AAC.1